MPLPQAINSGDALVYGSMFVMGTAAPAPNGLTNLVSPKSGSLSLLALAFQFAQDANVTVTIITKHGTISRTFVIPNGSQPTTTYYFDVPQDRANHVEAGEPFSIQSDGGGTGGGRGIFCAVIAGK